MIFENNVVKGPFPSSPIPQIPVGMFVLDEISVKDPDKVIVGWTMIFENSVVKGPSPSSFIPQIPVGMFVLDEISAKNPDKVIVIDSQSGQEVTYYELKTLSIKSAIALQKLGITKDDFVAMFAMNTLEYLTAFLGALYIGCKTFLLNSAYTIGELHHSLSFCIPKLALCSPNVVDKLLKLRSDFGGFKILLVGDDAKTYEGLGTFLQLVNSVSENEVKSFRLPDINQKEEIIAFMSSGTTGLPKAVAIPNNYLLNMIVSLRHPESIYFNDSQTTLGYLPFFHLFGIVVNLISVVSGTKLILMEKFISELFLKAIQDHKVSKLFAVPPILLFLTKSPLVETFDLSSILDIVCGAAPLPPEVEGNINRIFNLTVRQAYGTTEACVCSCVPRGVVKPGSVGNPNLTFAMKVWNIEGQQSLGPWKVGEICVKNDSMMKMYYGNEEETRASFDSSGFYRTGDLGYYDDDGYFYIVDRVKEIINCKGFKVAPTELEGILMKLPSVKDVGVIGIPSERFGEVPMAFVVKAEEVDVTEKELLGYVAENVSGPKKLKGGVRFVKEVPRTASGKILRIELRLLSQKLLE